MGVSTTHRINLSMWILIYSFSDTYYVWAACVVFVVLIRVQYWFRIKQEELSRKCLKGLDLKNFEIEM